MLGARCLRLGPLRLDQRGSYRLSHRAADQDIPPGRPVMPAEIADGCHHCVILISLTVPDRTDLYRRYGHESWSTWLRLVRFAGS